MSIRSTGVALIATGAFLMSMSYLAGAIFGNSFVEPAGRFWPDDITKAPVILSWLLLALGAFYLIRAEFFERRR